MPDSHNSYFKEIKNVDILTIEQEVDLFEKIRQGDTSAREKLIKSNLKFVVAQAFKFRTQGLYLPDLINEGNIGLIYAIEKFDSKKNIRFLTYAAYWIKKFIQKFIETKERIIYLPENKEHLLKRIKHAIKELEIKLNRSPHSDEISGFLDVPENIIIELLPFTQTLFSIDEVSKAEDEKGLEFQEKLIPFEHNKGEERLIEEEQRKILYKALSRLTDKQRNVIELYYGIGGEEALNLEAISQQLKISSERARQLREAGLKNLAKTIKLDQ